MNYQKSGKILTGQIKIKYKEKFVFPKSFKRSRGKGKSGRTIIECIPRNQEVVGSNPFK